MVTVRKMAKKRILCEVVPFLISYHICTWCKITLEGAVEGVD